MRVIDIAGAGISGLTAAIHLARSGFPVRVYERGEDVGSRFHGDFQGLENWSCDEDALAFLGRIGIPPPPFCRPFHRLEAVDDLGRRRTIQANNRTGIYLVKRGPVEDSVDWHLKELAMEAGVQIHFGRPVGDKEVHIVAKGPRSPHSVAYGIRAEVDHEDRILVFLDDRIAPKSYAYLVIVDGKMTLVSTLMERFYLARACFSKALERAEETYGLKPKNVQPMSGYIDFFLRDSYVDSNRMVVGECAGLQDFLFGFGMRYAFLSGYLAARCIVEGSDYDRFIREEMLDSVRASLINRYLFEKLGNRGYRFLIRRWAKSDDVLGLMRGWYRWKWYKRLIFPLARRRLARKE